MSYKLKDLYSPSFYANFAEVLKKVLPSFNVPAFTEKIFHADWENMELKDRMRHTSLVLHDFFPEDFKEATLVIEKSIRELQTNRFTSSSLEFMFFPDYIERFGLDHFEASVQAMEFVTQFTSCEFAVRPFILKYGDKMLEQMYQWSLHEDHRVRRLASEGSRPRLPWAVALPQLKKDPTPVLPLLNNLKNDPSEWVRKSVANHLNDISKDNPDIVIKLVKEWSNISKETDALLKHGCRTLLKQGHPEILKYYGLNTGDKLTVDHFCITTPEVAIGEHLAFSFTLRNTAEEELKTRLEYGVYYLRQNGTHSRKVFKISERTLLPGESLSIERKQSFKVITTRKFYPGSQKLSLIINGQEMKQSDFKLIA